MSSQSFLSSLRLKKPGSQSSSRRRSRFRVGSSAPLFGRKKKKRRKKKLQDSSVPNSFDPFPESSLPPPPPPSTAVRNLFDASHPLSEFLSLHPPLTSSDHFQGAFPAAQLESFPIHDGAVTAISVNPNGSRMVSGSSDHTLKLWDFHSTTYPMQPYREPLDEEGGPLMGSNPLNEIAWRPHCGSDRFIAVANTCKLKIFDRNCKYLAETVRGDMYLRDKSHVLGHTGPIYDVRWHPTLENSFATSSIDGTVRTWDGVNCHRSCFRSFKTLGSNRQYVSCTSLDWTDSTGSALICCTLDGTLHLFDLKDRSGNPTLTLPQAMRPGIHISRLRTSSPQIWCRNLEGEVRCWDLRMLRSGSGEQEQEQDGFGVVRDIIPCRHQQSDMAFGSDGRFVLMGVSTFVGSELDEEIEEEGETQTQIRTRTQSQSRTFEGGIVAIDRQTFKVVGFHPMPSPVIRLDWNESLSQIFCGCLDGNLRVLFQEEGGRSSKGILFPLQKKNKVVHIENLQQPDEIFLPHALPMYQKKEARGTRWAKNRRNDQKSFNPTAPTAGGVGAGGELGTSEQEILLKRMGIGVDDSWREDPRAALWKASAVASANPKFVDVAYGKKRARPQDDQDEDDEDEPQRKRRRMN